MDKHLIILLLTFIIFIIIFLFIGIYVNKILIPIKQYDILSSKNPDNSNNCPYGCLNGKCKNTSSSSCKNDNDCLYCNNQKTNDIYLVK
jgi:hypothetical protein